MKKIIFGVILLLTPFFGIGFPVIGPLVPLAGLVLIVWGIVSISKGREGSTRDTTFAGAAHSFVSKNTGIGIYPDKRTLLLKQGARKKEYSFADVREWEVNLQTGGHLIGNVGMAGVAHNVRTIRENRNASGLFVKVRDIETPVWRINMLLKDDQQRWMEILRQLINEQ
ncbi:MAG: hypothetical protein BGP10_14545 [Rhodanobacter sp. 68-29]|nr:DUF4755 domain-containing protein [Rhodanobacter sp.]ODU72724.1 MAG: hypothetical protein ABT17_15230 [Rhodanobacter sp. SCN 69-32]OJY61154.1 MAG: hypothetical protein BGP10_14545 [Rhodanobacter sp. 68-29]